MRVLLLHPDDVPWRGEWAASHWDLIVDLSFAGASVYQEWSKRTGARVISIHQFAGQMESYRWVNQLLEAGRNRFLDRMGLDWWELLASWSYHELQALYLLGQLREALGSGPVELAATREHRYVCLLRVVTDWPVRCISKPPSSSRKLVSRISTAAQNLRPSQMVEIAFDKWDPSYRLRSRAARYWRARLKEPAMLLPSAYFNVTRVQLAYAAQLPNRRFLMATTRRSGESQDLPSNVDSVALAAYAEDSCETQQETAALINTWDALKTELSQMAPLSQGFRAGIWNYFPRHLENGLRLRDAWQRLLASEPVSGVLCGDDLNYYTRLPLILAKRMGLTAVYCYHGALDGGLLFKKPYADLHLVKGEMEKDYVMQVSDLTEERIEIGAPAEPSHNSAEASEKDGAGNIVFFSQPFEVYGGRAGEIYREILPRLARLSDRTNRNIVIKLHPFESVRDRERLLRSVLPSEDCVRIEISRAPAAEIIARAWCGVGVDSSVAVECTLQGVPYFLCRWLDFNGFGYMKQFARFGAGIMLDTPDEILSIARKPPGSERDERDEKEKKGPKFQRLSQPGNLTRLDDIMFRSAPALTSTKCAS
jgi:hypothetical protein